MRIVIKTIEDRKNRDPLGTLGFIAVDGEGINVPTDGSHIDYVVCTKCDGDLTNHTRYRISETGPFCRECYFTGEELKNENTETEA